MPKNGMPHTTPDLSTAEVPQPQFPIGTPEYAAYEAELKEELGKFARGEEPYPYEPEQDSEHPPPRITAAMVEALRLPGKRRRTAMDEEDWEKQGHDAALDAMLRLLADEPPYPTYTTPEDEWRDEHTVKGEPFRLHLPSYDEGFAQGREVES